MLKSENRIIVHLPNVPGWKLSCKGSVADYCVVAGNWTTTFWGIGVEVDGAPGEMVCASHAVAPGAHEYEIQRADDGAYERDEPADPLFGSFLAAEKLLIAKLAPRIATDSSFWTNGQLGSNPSNGPILPIGLAGNLALGTSPYDYRSVKQACSLSGAKNRRCEPDYRWPNCLKPARLSHSAQASMIWPFRTR